MQRVLGIDLGTTNSVAAYMRYGSPKIIPLWGNEESLSSTVAVFPSGTLLVGQPAKGLRNRKDVIRSIKRFMGRSYAAKEVKEVLRRMASILSYDIGEGDDGGVVVEMAGRSYTPEEISSIILGRIKATAEAQTGLTFPRAVITVPAYFGESQVAATREAGRLAGFHVLRVLDEPTAAALAYGFRTGAPDRDQTVLVFDLGGGTFDVSLLTIVGNEFTGLSIQGDRVLGGDDFDADIVKHVLASAGEGFDAASAVLLREPAERAKIELSERATARINLPAANPISGAGIEADLTRAQFEDLIRARVEGAMRQVELVLQRDGLKAVDIDRVLLVGGSTAIPLVQERVAAVFGREKVHSEVDPMTAVALGAAIQGSLVTEIRCLTCPVVSSVAVDVCRKCDRDLTPPDVLACAICFCYTPATQDACGKCGAALPRGRADGDERRCPDCGGAVGSSGVCESCSDPAAGGMRCQNCDTIRAAGVTECPNCGTPTPTVSEVTAKSIGVELEDKSIAAVLVKGTRYSPGGAVGRREFLTAKANQHRLEIRVHESEDDHGTVGRELRGCSSMPLPPNLRERSPVDVEISYDSNRTISVEVHVKEIDERRKLEITNVRELDPDVRERLQDQRTAATQFIDRWPEDLTEAESELIHQRVEDMDRMLAGSTSSSAAAEEVIGWTQRLVGDLSRIRSTSAYLYNIAHHASRHLGPDEEREREQLDAAIEKARQTADLTGASTVAAEAEQFIRRLGPGVRALVMVRSWQGHHSLSPALAQQIPAAVRALDLAMDSDDTVAATRAFDKIVELEAAVWAEVGNSGPGDDVTGVILPDD